MSKAQRRWTPKEDAILREGVKLQTASQEGRTINWNEIAKEIPGRSNKDCRKRYCNEVTGGLKKGPWTEEEDSKLKSYVLQCGMSWALIAQKMRSRSADQCSKRWQHCLDPNLERSPWTDEENQRLLVAAETHGSSWKDIQTLHFPTRSANNIKNQYMIITRKSIQIPSGAPPCCSNLSPAAGKDQFDINPSKVQKARPDILNPTNLDTGSPVDIFLNSSTHNLFMDDNDMSLSPFFDDISSSDFNLALSDYSSSGYCSASALSLDYPTALDPNTQQDPFSSIGMDFETFADYPSVKEAQTSTMDLDSLPTPPSNTPMLCGMEDFMTVPSLKPMTTSSRQKSNSRVAITVDGADPETLMEVMNILIQSKAKVKFEATTPEG